ncbi:MAG TPA: hypothetical protein DIC64_02175 [Alphaproteobacteria bacterium]|nr:hypothetical protein [Alphaproteobacteria bacterium]
MDISSGVTRYPSKRKQAYSIFILSQAMVMKIIGVLINNIGIETYQVEHKQNTNEHNTIFHSPKTNNQTAPTGKKR